MKPILEVNALSKSYQIVHQNPKYYTLQDSILGMFKSSERKEEFWALSHLTFNIMPGEALGIIGRNGAGKSTLLKILSRITPPTKGSFIARGRVASLLEVGTGFHLELTGKENIFMNGSILGMRKTEIIAKFDEIVDFSGVEKFLDTPLKNYSSGMQLRLAFAVAAHLEPEILIIDEVLAVGDVDFQRKCISKMEDVARHGKTILFVSHNLDLIETLCKRSIILSGGKLVDEGPTETIIDKYILGSENTPSWPVSLTESMVLENLSFAKNSIHPGDLLTFKIKIKAVRFAFTDLSLLFYNYKKQRVAIYDLRAFLKDFTQVNDSFSFEGKIEHFNLVEGPYYIGLYFADGTHSVDLFDLVKIEVKNDILKTSFRPYDAQYRGFVELT
jgi:lipopolysaccharide transport system ATP-binding protein